MHSDDDEDSGKKAKSKGGGKAVKEFDCPDCNANNPLDEPLTDGAEIRCNYCGNEYEVRATDSGRFKFKAL
jgi:transcription elongation factor Elf1